MVAVRRAQSLGAQSWVQRRVGPRAGRGALLRLGSPDSAGRPDTSSR